MKYSFEDLLFNEKLILNYLEKLLIVVQEQMGYMESDNFKLDQMEYSLDKEDIHIEFKSLTNKLNVMTEMSETIIYNKKGDEKVVDIGYLHRFKDFSEDCVQAVVRLLNLCNEINLKPKVESKVKTILNLNKTLSKNENKNINIIDSVPNEIYGQEIEL